MNRAGGGLPHPPLFSRGFVLACAMHFTGAMGAAFYILFPLFVRRLGGGEFAIGLYAGLTGAAAVAVRVPLGRWLDTHGRRRVLAVAGTTQVLAWLSFTRIDRIGPEVAACVVLYGLASGALFAAYFTYASDIIPVERRSEGFGLFGIWGMLPNGMAPALGEVLIGRGGYTLYFLTAAGFALLSTCVALCLPETAAPRAQKRRVPEPAPGAHAAREPMPGASGQAAARAALPSLLATAFLFAVAMNGVFVFVAPFAYASGRAAIGGFFLCYSLTAVALRLVGGRLPDRVGLRRVLVPALVVYAAGVLLVPALVRRPELLLVAVLCGAGHGYVFPILNALAIEPVAAAHRGRAVTWLTAMFDLGSTLASPLLGALAGAAGFPVMFAAAGAIALASALLASRFGPERTAGGGMSEAGGGASPGTPAGSRSQNDEAAPRNR